MTNGVKGEVSLAAGGETYRMQFSVNGLVALEDALGVGVTDLGAQMQAPRIRVLRTLVWAALQEHHPDVDEAEAGRIMTAAGGLAVTPKILEAFRLAFPEAAKGTANPPKPPAKGRGCLTKGRASAGTG